MTITVLAAVAVPLLLLSLAVVRTVRADGHGHRPAPRSHLAWDEAPAAPWLAPAAADALDRAAVPLRTLPPADRVRPPAARHGEGSCSVAAAS